MKTEVQITKANKAYQVCQDCGIQYGRGIGKGKKQMSLSTWHKGICDICEETANVTEFRDFGYSKYL
jgi:hypothetical protein